MGMMDFFRREKRSQTVKSSDTYLAEFFGAGGRFGAFVDPERLMSNSAVAARCVNLRSEMLASTTLHVYRHTADGGREKATDHPMYSVLHDTFNPNMSAFEGREFLIRNHDLYGNAYARIERDSRGEVIALWPYSSGLVGVERLSSGRLRYRCTEADGTVRILLQEEILHLRGPSRDGWIGLSPIQYARDAMGLRVAQSETSTALVNNGLRPSGVLTYPDKLPPEKTKAARDQLSSRVQGPDNAGGFLVLDGGAKYETMSWTPQDAEFLASMKLSNEDVARIFGVPPTTVGITDKATYSNTEQEGRALVQNCLGPLAGRFEAALQRCILTPDEQKIMYVEHDLSVLLRGDMQARFEAYRIAREIGAFSPNDVRRRENEPPIADGDIYHQPANWVPLGTQAPVQGSGNNG
jgi:HK97 family phage portal protein